MALCLSVCLLVHVFVLIDNVFAVNDLCTVIL